MRIQVLAEGSTKWQRFIKHWGLSILVDDDILFDTFGQPDYILKQMRRFHIDPYRIRDIVISHDDWDHIAGLPSILGLGTVNTVYICPNFHKGVKTGIASYGVRVAEAVEPMEIRKNIWISGELKGGERKGISLPEQYLTVKTPEGVVIITGCAHPGIVEIVQHAIINFNSGVDILFGGFHLKDNAEETNIAIVRKLKDLGVRRVMPFHCTGLIAQRLFRKEFKRYCVIPAQGQIIEI